MVTRIGRAGVISSGSTTERDLNDRFSEVVNIKDFGAVGDDSTDDTTAIQNALTAGGKVFIPAGIYKITAALTMADDIMISGEGYTTHIKQYTATSEVFSLDSEHRCIIEKMRVSNTEDTEESQRTLILLHDCTECIVRDIWSEGDRRRLIYAIDSDFCLFESLFHVGAANNDYGDYFAKPFLLDGCVGSKFSNCHAKSINFGFTIFGSPQDDSQSGRTTEETHGNIIDGCTVSDHHGHAFDINCSVGNVVSNCTAENFTGTGSDYASTPNAPAYQNKNPDNEDTRQNIFIGCVAYNQKNGFLSQDGSNVVVTGCTFQEIDQHAIWLIRCPRAQISGCIIKNFGLTGIKVEDSDRCSVSDITMETVTVTANAINIEGSYSDNNTFNNITLDSILTKEITIGSGCNHTRFGPLIRCKTNANADSISDSGGNTQYPLIIRSDEINLASTNVVSGDFVPFGMQIVRVSFVLTATITGSPVVTVGTLDDASVNGIVTSSNGAVTGSIGDKVSLTHTGYTIGTNKILGLYCATAGTGKGYVILEGFVRN